MTSSLLGVACFLDQPFWFSLTKHLKCPLDHHFDFSLPSPTLGLPTKGGSPYTREKWSLSKEPFLILTWNDFIWLIHGPNLMKFLNTYLNPFLSTCLSPFLSTKWSPVITRTQTSSSSWVWSWSSNWVPNACQVHSIIKWPYNLYLSCL